MTNAMRAAAFIAACYFETDSPVIETSGNA